MFVRDLHVAKVLLIERKKGEHKAGFSLCTQVARTIAKVKGSAAYRSVHH